jgi:shikimate kinase
MGSGKSSVSRALAERLGWTFVDLDAAIENSQGRTIPEIFDQEGEAKFREIEALILRSILETTARPFVLATGGGTFVQSPNAELLRAHGATVIFLEVSAQTLLRRCCDGSTEPAEAVRPLAHNPDTFLRLYEERLPFYRTADLRVDADNRLPEAVAREIARLLDSM